MDPHDSELRSKSVPCLMMEIRPRDEVELLLLQAVNAREDNRRKDALEALEEATARINDEVLRRADECHKAIEAMQKGGD